MKARIKETGEIIEVQCLYSVRYSRLDANHKIIEEYDEDELELLPIEPKVKMVSLDEAYGKLKPNLIKLVGYDMAGKILKDFRKAMEEDVSTTPS